MKTEEILNNEWMFTQVENALNARQDVRIRLVGWSMYPFLSPKTDILVLAPVQPEELRPMDIVLAKVGNNYILHRLIRQEGNNWLMQGDANIGIEEIVSPDDVIGKLVQVERNGNKVVDYNKPQWKWKGRCWVCLSFCRGTILHLFRVRDRIKKKLRLCNKSK